ncbi:MAG: T9SS type A sorting domain-containing protein [Bacteroidia bacterium]|nr:T9SS type A sorting domain-containing protein [Bacteroidia bacterium]
MYEICFVFRNADGSIAGKNANGSDIYIHVFQEDVFARFTGPVDFPLNPQTGTNVPVEIRSTNTAMIHLYHDGNHVAQAYDTIMHFDFSPAVTGVHWLKFTAQSGSETITDTLFYIVQEPPIIENLPGGINDGINYINDSTVVLCIYAPYKQFVYLIGDMTNWRIYPAYQMKRTPDGNRYWLSLTGLVPQQEYGFQYFVDFDSKIGDPYADKALDRYNDYIIHPVIYPNLKPYPVGKTSELVSVFQTAQDDYQWEITNFQKPDNRDLVIYELLIRDFHMWHSYFILKDSMDYFKRLGINAIELMPVIDYDGYQSWGYMPAFYFAPDKYYGTKNAMKALVDECHKNGIAVILDIVLNHASGQNTFARLHLNKDLGITLPESPWFNSIIPHPYGYHHDFNHASIATQDLIDRILDYWLTEYKVDGFRFDLSKGFTNQISAEYDDEGNNIWADLGLWAATDQNRINYLKRMANVVWSNHSGTYMILEHLAGFDEEKQLSDHGFMLWCGANTNCQYKQAAISYNDQCSWDFKWGVSYQHYQGGNLGQHNLIGYMESHDEERLMYECLTYGKEYYNTGDTVPQYSIKNKQTALERMALIATFFFTVPGPKMLWMFEERGYDYSINWPAVEEPGVTRTAPKPPRWDYMNEPDRQRLYKIYAALINLKTSYSIFRTSNFEMHTSSADKRIRLWDDGIVGADMQVVVLGNFDVVQQFVWPEFSHSGTWYDFFSGDSLNITGSQTQGQGFTFQYAPGEYHIYTDIKLPLPDLSVDTTDEHIEEIIRNDLRKTVIYPNPSNNSVNINFYNEKKGKVTIKISNLMGQEIRHLAGNILCEGQHTLIWDGTDDKGNLVKNGYYLIKIYSNSKYKSFKVCFLNLP